MTVAAGDFYEFAQRIWKSASCEIDHRNAISRVYYAGYHRCMARLTDQGRGFTPETGHFAFCSQLLAHPAGSPLRALGVALNHLRHQRNAADYVLNRDFRPGDTQTAFGAYGNVVRLLEAINPANPAA